MSGELNLLGTGRPQAFALKPFEVLTVEDVPVQAICGYDRTGRKPLSSLAPSKQARPSRASILAR